MAQLLLPRWCPGCGRPEVSLCRECARGLSAWFRAEFEAEALDGVLPVWACGAYQEQVQRIILSWKSGQRIDLVQPIGRLGEKMGERIAPITKEYLRVLVVPAPSGWRRRLRGNEVVAPLAEAVAAGLRKAGIAASCASILHRRGGSNHGLSREQRLRERAGAISLHARRAGKVPTLSEGRRYGILLVDDVLTTGATLAASARAAAALGDVLGAIVLAATPKPM